MAAFTRGPVPVGYQAKRTVRLGERRMGAVEEVCSVSVCISHGPPGAAQQWRHNRLGFYADEGVALGVVPDGEDRAAYDLYAYTMLPIAFAPGGAIRELTESERAALTDASRSAKPLSSDYVCLGWDVVGNSLGWDASRSFECSPLTCDGMASQIATNRYGLIDAIAQALAAARQIAGGQPEPGDYYLVRVWRKGRVAER